MADCPLCEADEIFLSLSRRRYLNEDWLQSSRRPVWRILRTVRCGGDFTKAVILCQHRDGDPEYVVFTQNLAPRAIPTDKFFGSREAAEAYLEKEVRRLGNVL